MGFEKTIIILISVSILTISCNSQKRLTREKHRYMEDTYAEIKHAVNEAEVTILNDTLKVLFPSNMLFESNNAHIYTETLPILQRFANALNKYSKTNVLINGYTDATGNESLNNKLSTERADTVKAILILDSVAADRLASWGHGSKNPIGDNGTDEGKAKNRRVEFIILYRIAE